MASVASTVLNSRQPLADIRFLVQPPRLATVIVDRGSAHIPFILERKLAPHSPMHGTSVVPDKQVPHVFPLHLDNILGLRSVLEELFKQSL